MIPLDWILPTTETPGEQIEDKKRTTEFLPMKTIKSHATKISETKKRKSSSGKKQSSKQSPAKKRSKKKQE